MSKKSLLMCILTLVIVAWLAFGIPVAWSRAQKATVRGIDIVLTDPHSRFINAGDIADRIALADDSLAAIPAVSFDLYSLEGMLRRCAEIQSVNANILADGRVRVVVEPMVPVARVFDSNNPRSYYVNVDGKIIPAEIRYHIDVPVITGAFDSIHPASRLLPLLDFIGNDPHARTLVSAVTQEPDGNIIIVPSIVGHVVNFGDTSMVADKFRRLFSFYRTVPPTRGWDYYDTIAVKWRGRVVATRRDRRAVRIPLPTAEEQLGSYDEMDISTMTPSDSLSSLP